MTNPGELSSDRRADGSPGEAADVVPPSWRTLIVMVCGVVAALVVGAAVMWHVFGGPHDMGQFGDSFGSMSALFSGLAFGGLIYAVLLQRRELELQRHELRQTRGEMQLAREEAARSADAQVAAARVAATAALIEHEKAALRQSEHEFQAVSDRIDQGLTGNAQANHERLRRLHEQRALQEQVVNDHKARLARLLRDQSATYDALVESSSGTP